MLILMLVTLLDGSTVNIKVPDNTVLDVKTKYGNLCVPIKHIQTIDAGIHVDNEKLYQYHLGKLGSEVFKERDDASRFLKHNLRSAYKYLKEIESDGTKDEEVKKRVTQLLGFWRYSSPSLQDKVQTKDGTVICGDIAQAAIKGHSESLGDISIRLSTIRAIAVSSLAGSFKLEYNNKWYYAGYSTGHLCVKASGSVDLWVQQPGTCWCKPAGYTDSNGNGTNGFGNNFPGGALLGRINGGEPFVVGELFEADNVNGRLELKINNSPWQGSTAKGEYDVEIE